MTLVPRALWALALSLLFVASGTTNVAAQGNGPPDDPPGNGSGNGPPDDSGNETGNETGDGTANQTSDDRAPRSATARDRLAEERARLTGERLALERAPGLQAKYEQWQRLNADDRRAAGMFFLERGVVTGTYVSFEPDVQRSVLLNVTMSDGTVLFDEIWLPVDAGPARVELTGNSLRFRGEDWHFMLTDTPYVPMRMDATAARPILFATPDSTVLQTTNERILQLAYPLSDERHTAARFINSARPDPTDTNAVIVDGLAEFTVTAENRLLRHVSNLLRPTLEEARERGTLGAELTVLRAAGAGLYRDMVLYDDMLIDLAEGSATGEAVEGEAYTITVDAGLASGRTIAVTFEAGLVDPETLSLRYFNVDGERSVEGPIVMASSIHDVLDPSDDGTVVEYWVVHDIDGVQMLLSIPHFSVHKIELLSMIEIERPALIAGILGAVILVGVATRALVRRPVEE